MNGKIILPGLVIGTISGIVLGAIFKFFQWQFNIPLYTLLLAIDFIPVLDNLNLGEAFEFSLHMLISLIIGVLYCAIIAYFPINRYIIFALCLTFPTHFLYFVLTWLSDKTTLQPLNMAAFGLWVVGHVIYGLVLGYSFKKLYGSN